MNQYLLLLWMILCAAHPGFAAQAEPGAGGTEDCRMHRENKALEAGPSWCNNMGEGCSPEKRGRCGKRRGDWYGASQPVTSAAEARTLLANYFSSQEYRVSDVIEKKWGFKADVVDQSGRVIDRVMIDKRTGRIRSLN